MSQPTTHSAEPIPSRRRKLGNISGTLIALILVVVAVFGFVGLKSTAKKVEVKEVLEQEFPVSVVEANPRNLRPGVILFGSVEAPGEATLSAAVSADVQEVRALEGQNAEQGSLLISLDDTEARLAVVQAKANFDLEKTRYDSDQSVLQQEQELLELARREHQRVAELVKEKLASESQRDTARQSLQKQELAVSQRQLAVAQYPARAAQLRAQLKRAELDLSRTQIKAPYVSKVTKVHVAAGDRVSPGMSLISVYDASVIEVRALIPNRYLPDVQKALSGDQNAITAIVIIDGVKMEATLNRVAAASDARRGGLDGFFRVKESSNPLLVRGRAVRVLLELPAVAQAQPIPSSAVYSLSRIYRMADQRLQSLSIERLGEFVAEDGSAQLLIRSPQLRTGDQIVITQLPNATDGLKVRPQR